MVLYVESSYGRSGSRDYLSSFDKLGEGFFWPSVTWILALIWCLVFGACVRFR